MRAKEYCFVGPCILSAGHASFRTLNVFSLFRNWIVFEVPCWIFLSCWSELSSPMPAGYIQCSPGTGWSRWLQSLPSREGLYSGWLSAAWRRVLTRVSLGGFLCSYLCLCIYFASIGFALWWHPLLRQDFIAVSGKLVWCRLFWWKALLPAIATEQVVKIDENKAVPHIPWWWTMWPGWITHFSFSEKCVTQPVHLQCFIFGISGLLVVSYIAVNHSTKCFSLFPVAAFILIFW